MRFHLRFALGLFAATAILPGSMPLAAHPGEHEDSVLPWQEATPWPDRIVVTIDGDPATSLTVNWRTDKSVEATRAEIVSAAHLGERGLHISIDSKATTGIASRLAEDDIILDRTANTITVLLPILFATNGSKQKIVPATLRPPQPDLVLIAALRKAHSMLRNERGLPVMDASPSSPYDRKILRLAFLAPDIQRAILDGRQPLHLNLEALKTIDIPPAWSKQRQALGFAELAAPCSADQIP